MTTPAPRSPGGERGDVGAVEDQMALAVRAMAHHAGESWRTDRRGWTDEQWIEDAERLMDDIDGSVSSLVNGHVSALLRFWRDHRALAADREPGLREAVEALAAEWAEAAKVTEPGAGVEHVAAAHAAARLRAILDGPR